MRRTAISFLNRDRRTPKGAPRGGIQTNTIRTVRMEQKTPCINYINNNST